MGNEMRPVCLSSQLGAEPAVYEAEWPVRGSLGTRSGEE